MWVVKPVVIMVILGVVGSIGTLLALPYKDHEERITGAEVTDSLQWLAIQEVFKTNERRAWADSIQTANYEKLTQRLERAIDRLEGR